MDELEELVKAIYKGTPNDAMNCLVRYIEFGDWLDDDSQLDHINRADVYRYKYRQENGARIWRPQNGGASY
jgi:hypothetical protein